MQEFDFEIKYKPGNQNGNADAMSRIVCAVTRQQAPQLTDEQQKIKEEQENDPLYYALMLKLKGQALPASLSSENRKYVRQQWEKFRLRQNLLYRLGPMGEFALCITPREAKRVWEEAHTSLLGGHQGIDRTLSKIEHKYYWPTMKANVTLWTQQCQRCESRKIPHSHTRVPLQPMPAPITPFEIVSTDFLGPLPETDLGNKHIVLFIDYTTRWVEGQALPAQTAVLTAQAFVDLVIARHGSPMTLLSDRGRNFQSKLIAEICNIMDVRKISTTSYCPQANGLAENCNRTLLNTLSFFINKCQRNWDVLLPFALFAIRTSKQGSTRQSPFYLLYGRHARTPQDIQYGQPIGSLESQNETFQERMDSFPGQMQAAWEEAKKAVEKAKKVMKTQYDKRVTKTAKDFNVGDHVYMYQPSPKKGISPKLQCCYRGPSRIVEVTDTNARIIPLDTPRAKPQLVHLNRLKKARYQGPRFTPEEEGANLNQTEPDESEPNTSGDEAEN